MTGSKVRRLNFSTSKLSLAVMVLALALSGCFASFSSRGSATAPAPSGSSAAVVTRTGGNSVQVNSQGAQIRMDARTYLGIALGLAILDGLNYLHHALKTTFAPPAPKPADAPQAAPWPDTIKTRAPASR